MRRNTLNREEDHNLGFKNISVRRDSFFAWNFQIVITIRKFQIAFGGEMMEDGSKFIIVTVICLAIILVQITINLVTGL